MAALRRWAIVVVVPNKEDTMTMQTTNIQLQPQVHTEPGFAFSQVLKKIGPFALWVLSGFGLVPALWSLVRSKRTSRSKAEEISVYCVHRSFYLWALILSGFVASAAVARYPHSATVWGWAYIAIVLYTLATLLFDVGTLRLLLWTGIVAFVWLTCRYLEDLKHVAVLSSLTGYLKHLHPRLDPGTASVLSWLLLIPWVGALFYSFTRGRTTFSPNSIEEYFLGEGREITDRSGLTFRSRYRDLLETLLGIGAGDLEAIDASGKVVKRWENIPLLAFTWPRLDHILHQRSALVDNAPEDPVEVEQVSRR
jgi:hypothetical protein